MHVRSYAALMEEGVGGCMISLAGKEETKKFSYSRSTMYSNSGAAAVGRRFAIHFGNAGNISAGDRLECVRVLNEIIG